MLEGLRALSRPVEVTIYTDSKYLKNSIGNWNNGKPIQPTGWIVNWKQRGWRRKEGALKNVDLWKALWGECEKQKSVRMRWVRGHSGDYYNERCDALAVNARLGRGWDVIMEDITEDD